MCARAIGCCRLTRHADLYARSGRIERHIRARMCVDELSYALGIDPIELRRRNEPDIDEGENRPFSSRSLLKCYELGADRFGWSRRDPRPRSMRDGRLLIGMGVASATYPAAHSPSSARVRLLAERHRRGRSRGERHGAGHLHLDDTGRSRHARPADRAGPLRPRPFGLSGGPAAWRLADDGVGRLGRSAPPASPCTTGGRKARRRRPALSRVWYRTERGGVERGTAFAAAAISRRGRPTPISWRVAVSRSRCVRPRSVIPISRASYSMHAFGAVFVEVAVDPDVGH